jgi:hypothetical protein
MSCQREDIQPEAWEAAFDIDAAVEEFLNEHGLKRNEGGGAIIEAIAKFVQHAIDKSHERRSA